MTRFGRKPQGAELVDYLMGSDHAKARLKAFLATLSGELGAEEACQKLGICLSRFFEQRSAWLHESLGLLEPRAAGRPRKEEPTVSAEEARSLRDHIQELEARAAAVEVQSELARTLPHVMARAAALKKTSSHGPGRPNRPK